MTPRSTPDRPAAAETRLAHAGRDPFANHGIVNPPVYHASTILFPTLAALEEANRTPYDGTRYGRRGTPTTFALEDAVAELEGGFRAVAVPSGLAAITTALLAFVGHGDHVLMVDTAYTPTRRFCDTFLKTIGVETTYYDPLADIRPQLRETTRVVFLESPGSLTYEIQDVAAVVAAARRVGAVTIIDNTWSAGLYFKPFAHGIDVSIQAATKYIVGHSDVMLGVITTNEASYLRVRRCAAFLGLAAGPDDCYLALRGLRTLAVRLPRHQENALAVAGWLAGRPEVARVLYPALPASPGHELWRRDFTGANGLVSVVLTDAVAKPALAAMLDGLTLFRLGYSWGGYESLIVPFDARETRSATTWTGAGAGGDRTCLRLHCGLEHPADQIADLEAGLARLAAAG